MTPEQVAMLRAGLLRVAYLVPAEQRGWDDYRAEVRRSGHHRPAPYVLELARRARRTCRPSEAELHAAGYVDAWQALGAGA